MDIFSIFWKMWVIALFFFIQIKLLKILYEIVIYIMILTTKAGFILIRCMAYMQHVMDD